MARVEDSRRCLRKARHATPLRRETFPRMPTSMTQADNLQRQGSPPDPSLVECARCRAIFSGSPPAKFGVQTQTFIRALVRSTSANNQQRQSSPGMHTQIGLRSKSFCGPTLRARPQVHPQTLTTQTPQMLRHRLGVLCADADPQSGHTALVPAIGFGKSQLAFALVPNCIPSLQLGPGPMPSFVAPWAPLCLGRCPPPPAPALEAYRDWAAYALFDPR